MTAMTRTKQPTVAAVATELRYEMTKRTDLLRQILPPGMTPERFIAMAGVVIGRTPKLAECTVVSLVQSMIKSAELGLDFTGTLGSAYLVPFRDNKKNITEAQLIIGYRGLADLARGGGVLSIESRVVYEGDEFAFEYGLVPKLVHRPAMMKAGKSKPPVCFYAVAKLAAGDPVFEVMSKAQVDAIRASSRGKDGPAWTENYPEMGRKTVTRRLTKLLPLSPKAAAAIYDDDQITGIDTEAPAPKSSVQDLDAALDADDPMESPEAGEQGGDQDGNRVDGEEVDKKTGEVSGGTPRADDGMSDEQKQAAKDREINEILGGKSEIAQKFLYEHAKKIDPTIGRPAFAGGMFKYAQSFGVSVEGLNLQLLRTLYDAISEERFAWKTGLIIPV